MRTLIPIVLLATLTTAPIATRASATKSADSDAAQIDLAGSTIGSIEVVITTLAFTAAAVMAIVERPAPADAHGDPQPCNQW